MKIYRVWYTNENRAFNLWETTRERAEVRRAALIRDAIAQHPDATQISEHEMPRSKAGMVALLNTYAANG